MSESRSSAAAAVGVENVVPILSVANLATSIRFYVDVLGFTLNWGGEDGSDMAGIARDGWGIMLCQGAQGQPGTWVWIGVQDIGPLYEAWRAQGVRFRLEPTNYSWAYEMRVEDPDGHVLRLGSDPKPGLPFADL